MFPSLEPALGTYTGNGTIRRYGLVGVGVVLLEEVCHCEGRL